MLQATPRRQQSAKCPLLPPPLPPLPSVRHCLSNPPPPNAAALPADTPFGFPFLGCSPHHVPSSPNKNLGGGTTAGHSLFLRSVCVLRHSRLFGARWVSGFVDPGLHPSHRDPIPMHSSGRPRAAPTAQPTGIPSHLIPAQAHRPRPPMGRTHSKAQKKDTAKKPVPSKKSDKKAKQPHPKVALPLLPAWAARQAQCGRRRMVATDCPRH